MIPLEGIIAVMGLAVLLAAVRYLDARRFFRTNGPRLRELETVPWVLRARLLRPSFSNTTAGLLIVTKLVVLLGMAPMMVGIGLAIAPEQITITDMAFAGVSAAILTGFLIADPIIMQRLRRQYDIPPRWKELLR